MCCVRYDVDETNPEESLVEAMFDEESEGTSYQILSKKVAPRTASAAFTTPLEPPTQQHNGRHSTTEKHAAAVDS